MSPRTVIGRYRGGRALTAAVVVLVFIGLTAGGPTGTFAGRINDGIRGGVQCASDMAARCWMKVTHACDVAAGSFRLLARIGRELSPAPAAVSPIPDGAGTAAPRPRTLLTVHEAPCLDSPATGLLSA